ncbi:hypothetical protein [Cellulomonas sp. SLBN-39]|uniref:hypothetical protein n=1 Tax=Cellulomonas sp. SLBN-39 TaxID=2768446 RepID=UPI00115171AC|nr:hypothetical protein [Cellulomonas sp. SLBN-39]TQL02646.1 ABC-2 type transport system permease protein [Cellulomonas sp. SLBN-39]
MSAPTAAPRPAATTTRPGAAGVVASEWTRLVSLRAPWWTAAVTVVVAGIITYLSVQASSGDPGFDPMDSLTTGVALAQLGPLVLGVLAGAGEYGTGAFRSTFTAVPRRWPVLAAQAVAVAVFTLGAAVLATAASVVALLPAAASRGIAVDLTVDATPGVLVGMVLLLVGLALVGLGLGALLRRSVPALVTAVLLVLVLPVVLTTVGDPGLTAPPTADATVEAPAVTLAGTVALLTPGMAGGLMTVPASSGPVDGAPDLGPVGGGLALAGWVALLLGAATVRLTVRDVR